MSDSDGAKVILDDESMDEVHELEDELQGSVNTAASSPIKGLHGDSSGSEGSDSNLSSDSSSEDGDFLDRNDGASMGGFGRARADQSSDEDSDEPPEIPGSPIAQNLQVEVIPAADFEAAIGSSALSPERSDVKTATGSGGEEEEYEAKEVEQPRAAEFHASSSSEDEDESYEDGDRTGHSKQYQLQMELQMERSALGRPKTAAKDLEKYRDVVPNEFFQQFDGATDASSPSLTLLDNSVSQLAKTSARISSADRERNLRRRLQEPQYKVPVPREVEELFSLTDAYTPEEIEIETRLEPFLPEFSPSVGQPFDGIQIPRPDGKEDSIGVDVLREPSGQTNVAELELLMQVTHQSKLRRRSDVVRSIERAPQEIDQWIASVEKVQRAKPLAEVNYKQAMPPLARLMELWPEEFEDLLATRSGAIAALSGLDVSFKELAKIVCALVDIPVYEGNCVQSLHVLFSLYLEIEAYERDQQGSQR